MDSSRAGDGRRRHPAARRGGGGLLDVAFVPETSLLVTTTSEETAAGQHSRISFMDTTSGDPVSSFLHDAHARLAVAPSGDAIARADLIASASLDGSVALLDAETGLPRWSVPAHSGYAYAVAFSPDGGRLVSAGCVG